MEFPYQQDGRETDSKDADKDGTATVAKQRLALDGSDVSEKAAIQPAPASMATTELGVGHVVISHEVKRLAVAVGMPVTRHPQHRSRRAALPLTTPEQSTPTLVCSELETLGNVSLCGTALDRALLLTSDGAGFLQVIGHVGDTTHELAMVAGALGACRNEVRDRAATGEQGIGDPRIAAINDNGGAQIGIGALILIIRYVIPIAICVSRQ